MDLNIILFVVVVSTVSAIVLGEDDQFKEEMEIYKIGIDFVDECGSRDLSLCLKERALKYIDNLPNALNLGGGLKIKPNGRFPRKTTIERLPDAPQARENVVGTVLWNHILDYLNSHTIEFNLPSTIFQEMTKSIEEGRSKSGSSGGNGNKGGGGGMQMNGMMMLLPMKAAVLGAITLKFIGFIAFKALLAAKIALTISLVIALKKLVEQKHQSPTFEIIAAHPHEEYGHYDRSFSQKQLAYSGYKEAASSKN